MIMALVIAATLIGIGICLMIYVNTKSTLDEIISDQKTFETGQWSDPNE